MADRFLRKYTWYWRRDRRIGWRREASAGIDHFAVAAGQHRHLDARRVADRTRRALYAPSGDCAEHDGMTQLAGIRDLSREDQDDHRGETAGK